MTQATHVRFYAFTPAVVQTNTVEDPDNPGYSYTTYSVVTPSRRQELGEAEVGADGTASFDSGEAHVDYATVHGGSVSDDETTLGAVKVGKAGEITVDTNEPKHLHINRMNTRFLIGGVLAPDGFNDSI